MSNSPKRRSPTARSASRAEQGQRSSKAPNRFRVIPYEAGPGRVALAPMLELEIVGPDGRRFIDSALIDTGADTSAFPTHWMRRLGILKKDCVECDCQTAGGSTKQWRYQDGLRAVILGRRVRLEACFADTPVVLLGREDFLGRFDVRFDQPNCQFRIRAY